MRDPLENVKPQVRALRPYSLRFEDARIKLNQNENPWDTPSEIKLETFRRLESRHWSRYPEFIASRLIGRLAEFSNWTADGTLVGNGSNELIQAVLMVAVSNGKRVLINEPTFSLYRQVTTILGGEIVSVPLTAGLTYDVEAMRMAIPLVKPVTTGRGKYLTAVPIPVTPRMTRRTPAIMVQRKRPSMPYFAMMPATTTTKAPVGPPICVLEPPSAEMTKPVTIAQ